MTSSTPNPIPANYQRLRPRFNRQYAEDMTHWADDPTLVQGMFYAFVFQDALHFGLCSKHVIPELADVIENCRWAALEAWLNAHRDSLIQHHEVEAPASSFRSASFSSQREPLSRRRNVGDEASSGASTAKSSPRRK
uniref:Uncharacterized protein n=2 Tax=Opuntia streptacantha TaxID=393608 RepID=A0A7C8ZH26_OPUST